MKTTKIYILALLMSVLGTSQAFAQDEKAKELLGDLTEKMKATSSFSADFNSKIVDRQADMESSQKGSIKVAGDKFELTLGDNTVISDGITVWTYNTSTNEVMIDNLDEMFEDDINPTKMYTIWEEGFKSSYAGEADVADVHCEIVKLFPNEPADKNYHTIILSIDTRTPEIKKVNILGKDGTDVTYILNNFKKQSYASVDFHFNKSDHPGVEIIDNR